MNSDWQVVEWLPSLGVVEHRTFGSFEGAMEWVLANSEADRAAPHRLRPVWTICEVRA